MDNTPFTKDAAPSAGEPQDSHSGPSDLQKLVSSLPVDHAGTTVYVKGWRRAADSQQPIIIVHDLGEHTELYRTTAREFIAAGYAVYIFDLRGHGRSGRRLGHAPSFDVLVKDLLQVAAWVRHKERGKAPIILGHGIGALITIEFTKAHGNFCKAAILSAPTLELTHEISPLARMLVRVLAEIAPTFRMPTRLTPLFTKAPQASALDDAEEASDTHQEHEGGRTPYFPRLTAIFTQELLNAIKRTVATFIEYHGSVLILCPEQDSVCNYAALKKSAALHNEHNLRIVDLPDTDHGIFTSNEAARKTAMAVILPWLETVLRAKLDIKIEGASKSVQPASALEVERPGASTM